MKLNIGMTVGILSVMVLCSCSGRDGNSLAEKASGSIESYAASSVNAAEQGRPTIMVIPSDNLLQRYGALTYTSIGGARTTNRDYKRYLLSNSDNKALISMIADNFAQNDYPVQDFEQTLKRLDIDAALDMADGVAKNAKTLLLTAAQPDLIIELDYQKNLDVSRSGSMASEYSYVINVIDAYTNNVVSSSSRQGLEGKNALDAVAKPMEKDFKKLNKDMTAYFSDLLKRGRNVTIRINMKADCPFGLENRNIAGSTYSDWILDYVKTHTVKGAYKLQRNTDKEMYFVNCRIPLLADDNTQFSAYDWARIFTRQIYNNLGVVSSNKAQGLGDIVITIDGLK